MQANRTTMLQLGYLGLLPFIGSLALVITDNTLFSLTGQQLFTSYSAIILSFLSGVLWGRVLNHFTDQRVTTALIFSNVFALLAWAVLLFDAHSHLPVLLLALGFLAVWFVEKQTQTTLNTSPEGYQTMRNRLTVGVIALHLVFLVL